jgi:hypothetical protein
MTAQELSALKLRENGLSDRADLQDSRFEVVQDNNNSYLVSRESILGHQTNTILRLQPRIFRRLQS